MKRKDLVIVVFVAVFAAILSFVVSNALFGSPAKNPIKVPVVHKIDSTFPDVKNDTSYTSFFNNKAINPTQLIQIGNSTNNAPFQTTNGQ
jgi:hypothetical protein